MPHLDHVNLGVPTNGMGAEASFLTDVLGLRWVDPGPEAAARGANWFEDDDGIQIHLSLDPHHQPAERAHVALSIEDLPLLEERLGSAGIEFTSGESDGLRVLVCRDPSGNRWELRGRRRAA